MISSTPRSSRNPRSWSILLQTVLGASRSFFLFILLTHSAHAIVDTNLNGVSDLWEKTYNSGSLIANVDPLADPDGDGWTHAIEAIAGTNPFNANTPTGILRPEIIQSPAVYITGTNGEPEILTPAAVSITWPTLSGKQYTLFISVDLTPGSWLAVDNATPRIGTTAPMGNAFPISQPDGSTPPTMFYRVAINDADSDGDTLTNHEEAQLGTDPFSSDTDLDGLPDNIDPAPLTSRTLSDPDGAGLLNDQNLPTSLAAGLLGRWNFEDHQIITNPPTGYTPYQYPDSTANNRHATSHGVFPHLEGMVSKATNHAGGYVSLPTAVLGVDKTYTTAFWALLEPGSIVAANGAPVALFSHHQRIPWLINGVPQWGRYAEQLNGLWFEKSGNQERLRAGTHIYTNHLNGVPTAGTTTSLGVNILRDAGTADDGKWHHYTFVHNDGIKTLYIDGIQVGTATHTPATISINSIYSGISLGRISGPSPGAAGYFQGTSPTSGRIDRLRIWDRPLGLTEATALYREDIDKDGLWDITENNRLWRDNNSDTLQTTNERTYSSSPFTWQTSTSDTDDDELTDIDEQTRGTQINNPDSDGDLLPDGWEVTYSLPPVSLNPLVPNDPNADTDNDDLTLLDEYRYNTSPNNPNTDGDSKNDGNEVGDGSRPNDPRDNGNPTPPEQKISILLGIGDESGSESEDYVLHCYRLDPQTGQEQRIHTLRSGGYGQYSEESPDIFIKGESYTFQIDWQSSNLATRPSSPGVSAEGPDYDYTFKVQPQGANTGILIDGYDPKTKTVGPSILAEEASDVATTEDEFKENYEKKRVAVLNPTLEWVAVDGYDNIDNHIDPWGNPIGGKRIFPDFKDPSTTQIRHAVQLVVSGTLSGLPVYVKAFDVDDSTAETFDLDADGTSPVIDVHGKAGDDNFHDYLSTPKNGQFWTGFAWGSNSFNQPADAVGQAKFIFRVGMQPGNNYRAVASVNNESMYTGIQTASPTTAKYLGPEAAQTGEAPASPLLTVWRRLWVENDSMEAIPKDPAPNFYKRNDLSSDIANPIIEQATLNFLETDTIFLIQPISDGSSFSNLENGYITFGTNSYSVTGTGLPSEDHLVSIAGNHTMGSVGSNFRLYDDDDFGLNHEPFPRNNLIDGVIEDVYEKGFIDVIDASNHEGIDYNPDKTVGFKRNHPTATNLLDSTVLVWEDSKNLFDKAGLWVGNLVAGYQNIHNDDADPRLEEGSDGLTPEFNRRYSVVYVETIRDAYDSNFRDSPQHGSITNNQLVISLKFTAAHELGHMPGGGFGFQHHNELQLMGEGGAEMNDNGTSFSAKSVLRFRKTTNWQQPSN